MVLFWHRRDLRIEDNAGLFKALKENDKVQPIFIFDALILAELPRNDQRVRFIHQEIQRLKKEYQELGSDLKVYFGNPIELIPTIAERFSCSAVYTLSLIHI
jgi:deoxyribodipyrimidine photo-lyase